MYDAFQYTIDNAGLDKEDIYPYKGKVSRVNNGVSIVINYYNMFYSKVSVIIMIKGKEQQPQG